VCAPPFPFWDSQAVPIDIHLRKELPGTGDPGPNREGKTVALKTGVASALYLAWVRGLPHSGQGGSRIGQVFAP